MFFIGRVGDLGCSKSNSYWKNSNKNLNISIQFNSSLSPKCIAGSLNGKKDLNIKETKRDNVIKNIIF